MKKVIIGFTVISLLVSINACGPKKSALEKRKQQLERKKKRNPDDCPKIDC